MSQTTFVDQVLDVTELLTDEPQTIDQIATVAGLGIADTSYILALAALHGQALEVWSGSFISGLSKEAKIGGANENCND
jgi:predicted Rossmann fold nucleotide-binding protein DprA/Smf involved in DNA uptake